MMKKHDGGAAFPRTGEGFGNPLYDAPGMSLRDWFAGQFFGIIMCGPDIESYTQAARRAYEAADAMLAERERTGE